MAKTKRRTKRPRRRAITADTLTKKNWLTRRELGVYLDISYKKTGDFLKTHAALVNYEAGPRLGRISRTEVDAALLRSSGGTSGIKPEAPRRPKLFEVAYEEPEKRKR